MLRRQILLRMILTTCLHACSCISHGYTTCVVEITPTATGFERQLKMYRTEVSDSSRTQPGPGSNRKSPTGSSAIYGARPDATAPYVGRGHFTSIPDDLNNWGSLRSYPSALGGCWMYAERMEVKLQGPGGETAAKICRRGFTDSTPCSVGPERNWDRIRTGRRLSGSNSTLTCAACCGTSCSTAFTTIRDGLDRLLGSLFEQPLSFMAVAATPPSDEDTDVILARWLLQEVRARMAKTLGLESPAEIKRVLHYISDPDSARRSFARYVASTTGAPTDSASWTRTMSLLMGDNDLSDGGSMRIAWPCGWCFRRGSI